MTGSQINIKSHSFSVLTRQVMHPAGSPGASGTYPLAILSDEETEAGGSAGRPMRAHSLRNALQSWRSIRTALGDRHASHASAFAAAAGTSGDADEESAPAQVRLCWLHRVLAWLMLQAAQANVWQSLWASSRELSSRALRNCN